MPDLSHSDTSSPLEGVLRRAGAVIASRDGHSVAAHYGSPGGELAVCVRAVGLIDRSEFCKLVLTGVQEQLADVLARLIGRTISPGGALSAGGAWWCAASDDRVLVLTEPASAKRLLARVRAGVRRHVGVTWSDISEEVAAIGVIGRATPNVLAALGAYGPAGDARLVAPFASGRIAGADVQWLFESDRRALALVRAEEADQVWRAIENAGRPFGISCVGREAAERFALLDRPTRAAMPRA